MLIYCFHHPSFHYAAWMWFVNINILSRLFILESYTRAGCCTFVVFTVSKNRQQLQQTAPQSRYGRGEAGLCYEKNQKSRKKSEKTLAIRTEMCYNKSVRQETHH